MDYISSTLSLDDEDGMMYSHIIRQDGTFVIRSGDAFRENYFDRIQSLFEEQGESGEQYIRELEAAMDKGEDYSALMVFGSERRHLQCNKLPYSEWYLVTVLPYGELDQAVSDLSHAGCTWFPGLRRGAAGPAAGVICLRQREGRPGGGWGAPLVCRG